MTCPRCGLPGYDEPGEGHLCFHPTTGKQYADQVNEDLHRVFPPNPPPESPAQEQPGDTVTCEKCAFRYGAEHKLADGSYSCPVCALAQAQARIAELEEDAARYRWWRNKFWGTDEDLDEVNHLASTSADEWDAAIDAALNKAQENGR